MATILALAADFIDKMYNPANGIATNEEYAIRFARLIEDEQFDSIIRTEVGRMREEDVNILTTYGWIWLLKWCINKRIRMNEKLLTQLMRRWSDVFIQALIIRAATFDADGESEWLLSVIREIVRVQQTDEREGPQEPLVVNTSRAETLLIALLQIGDNVSLAGARYLLSYEWSGQEKLRSYFTARFALLDEETKRAWAEQLRL